MRLPDPELEATHLVSSRARRRAEEPDYCKWCSHHICFSRTMGIWTHADTEFVYCDQQSTKKAEPR